MYTAHIDIHGFHFFLLLLTIECGSQQRRYVQITLHTNRNNKGEPKNRNPIQIHVQCTTIDDSNNNKKGWKRGGSWTQTKRNLENWCCDYMLRKWRKSYALHTHTELVGTNNPLFTALAFNDWVGMFYRRKTWRTPCTIVHIYVIRSGAVGAIKYFLLSFYLH